MLEPQANGGLGDEGVAAERAPLSNTLTQSREFRIRLRLIHQGTPLPRFRDGPVGHDRGVRLASILPTPEAAVLPVFRVLDEIGPQRVSLNVAHDGQQMPIIFDRERLKSPLIKMPRSFGVVMSVPTHCMSVRQPPKELRQFGVARGANNEMPVVRHNQIGKNRKRNSGNRFFQHSLERFIVFRFLKKRQPSDGTVQNVKANIGWADSGAT